MSLPHAFLPYKFKAKMFLLQQYFETLRNGTYSDPVSTDTMSCRGTVHLGGWGHGAEKVSLNSVRLVIERPSVSSSVYSISLPTCTPRAITLTFTPVGARRRNM